MVESSWHVRIQGPTSGVWGCGGWLWGVRRRVLAWGARGRSGRSGGRQGDLSWAFQLMAATEGGRLTEREADPPSARTGAVRRFARESEPQYSGRQVKNITATRPCRTRSRDPRGSVTRRHGGGQPQERREQHRRDPPHRQQPAGGQRRQQYQEDERRRAGRNGGRPATRRQRQDDRQRINEVECRRRDVAVDPSARM